MTMHKPGLVHVSTGELMDEFEVVRGMDFLGKTYGKLCPMYWHHIADMHLHLCVNWNAEHSVSKVFKDVDVKW